MNGQVGYCWKEIVLLAILVGGAVFWGTSTINENINIIQEDIAIIKIDVGTKATERNELLGDISKKLDDLNITIECE